MDRMRLAALIKSRREASLNPATGRPWTVVELACRLNLPHQEVSRIEHGRKKLPPDPEVINGIAKTLGNVSVLELVQAMGYDAKCPELEPEDLRVVEHLHRLPPDLRDLLRRQILATQPLPAPP